MSVVERIPASCAAQRFGNPKAPFPQATPETSNTHPGRPVRAPVPSCAAANAGNNTAGVITATDKAKLDIAIVGNTSTQTAPTIIQTVTQTEYNNLTPVASTIYIIV